MKPSDPDWPRCACGCGEPVPVRKASLPSKGLKKGEPCKFVANHSNRVRHKLPVDGKLHCPRCDSTKPVESFRVDKSRPAGRCSWCLECERAKTSEWGKRNRAHRTEVARRWRESRGPEYQRENVARWRKNNYPHHLEKSQMYASTRRARVKGQFVEDIDRVVVFERDNGICGLCGMAIVGPFTIDHIVPISKGGPHSYANVQLAHPTCNFSKRDRTYVKDAEEQAQGD